MQAIKLYTEVINGSIHIDLPKDYTAKRVELIIVSADDNNADSCDFQRFLLDSPEMSDEEYQAIEEKKAASQPMDMICLDTNILIAHKRAKKAGRLGGQWFSPERDSIVYLIAGREAGN